MIFAKYQDEFITLFLSLNLLELNIYLISLFTYSYLRNDLPELLYSYDTRSISHIFIDNRRTNYETFSLKYRGAQEDSLSVY